jgi:hypothetical protein
MEAIHKLWQLATTNQAICTIVDEQSTDIQM